MSDTIYPSENPYTTPVRVTDSGASALFVYTDTNTGEEVTQIHITEGGLESAIASVISESNQATRKLLKGGHMLHRLDGSKVWRCREPIWTPGERYEWHEDGERVRCAWTEITMSADGVRSIRDLRRVWVHFDRA
jgi:hypothetical protein